MEDIAPELLESIQQIFRGLVATRPRIKTLYAKIYAGEATYIEAQDYAYEIGRALSQAFGKVLTPDAMPDGRMYYNIADRVLRPMLIEDHKIVADAAAEVEKALNKRAKIGLKVQIAELNEDRVQGIIDKISEAERFADVAWVLEEPIQNFSMNVVDETIRRNAEFHSRAGLRAKIIRTAEPHCCKWCSNLEGEYEYPDNIPDDLYRRHDRCRCTVEYDPGSGRRQDVHTKRWNSPEDPDIIEERRKTGLQSAVFRQKEYKDKIGNLVRLDGEAITKAAKNKGRHRGVYADAQNKTKRQLEKSIINRTAEVERHAEKMAHPEKYIENWGLKEEREQAGLIRKWEKDMKRNAEQASIELSVYKERFS